MMEGLAPNPERGELRVRLGGRERLFRVTFDGLVRLEEALGDGILQIARKAAQGALQVKQIALIYHHLMADEERMGVQEIGQALVEEGYVTHAPAVTALLNKALVGLAGSEPGDGDANEGEKEGKARSA